MLWNHRHCGFRNGELPKDKGKQRAEVGHCLGENKTAVMLVRKSDGDKVTMDKTHR